MNSPLAESYLLLLLTELIMACRGFTALHGRVRQAQVRTNRARAVAGAEEVSHAMDLACVFYPKHVLCLQRSAATALLFRRHGIRAEMVIGAQTMPFQSHAWVEIDGAVVNDKAYMREIFRVLERC